MEPGIDTRISAVAGAFYPENPEQLRDLVGKLFSGTSNILPQEKVRAIIVPHAGYIYSGQTAAWGYKQLNEKNETSPPSTSFQAGYPSIRRFHASAAYPTSSRSDRDFVGGAPAFHPRLNRRGIQAKGHKNSHFVLLGPSHSYLFMGLAASSSKFWETPLGKTGQESRRNERKRIVLNDLPHVSEHCLEVQLPFLQYLFNDFSMSAYLTGVELDYNSASDFFLANYPQSTFIISSDLSHYLPEKEAREKDKKTIGAILKTDLDYFKTEENAACGREGILIGMTMAKKMGWKGKLIYYDTSATTSGDTNSVVGYAAIGFY